MNKELEKLKEIKASIEKLDKEYRTIKGYGECCDKPCPAEVQDILYSLLNNVYRYIDSSISGIWRWQDDHVTNKTHLPKLSASQIENLLDAAGAEDDFEVQKPIIWASAKYNSTENKDGVVIELQIDKSKDK